MRSTIGMLINKPISEPMNLTTGDHFTGGVDELYRALHDGLFELNDLESNLPASTSLTDACDIRGNDPLVAEIQDGTNRDRAFARST